MTDLNHSPPKNSQAYGPLTVTHQYPFATKSLTGLPGEYPNEGKSFAQVVQITLRPITETTNSLILMISPFLATQKPICLRLDIVRHLC